MSNFKRMYVLAKQLQAEIASLEKEECEAERLAAPSPMLVFTAPDGEHFIVSYNHVIGVGPSLANSNYAMLAFRNGANTEIKESVAEARDILKKAESELWPPKHTCEKCSCEHSKG